ncbi:MAG: competence protein CoiA family protein [Saprospiraceae bacterium]
MSYHLPYALRAGAFVHIGEVQRGLKCGCECPACGEKLVAKKGLKNGHHFAHYSGQECTYSVESTLHYLAKAILEKSQSIRLPPAFLPRQDQPTFGAQSFTYQTVKLEKGLGGVIPDLILGAGKQRLLVEIKVSHPVDRAKLWRLRRQGMSAIEMDAQAMFKRLFGQAGQFNEERFRQLLIADIQHKYWLHNPRLQAVAYRLKQQAEKKAVFHRQFKDYHLYAVNACPQKKRYWKTGYQTGKAYGNLWQDCQHCPYCLEIEFEKAFVAYQEVPLAPKWVYCWGHLV